MEKEDFKKASKIKRVGVSYKSNEKLAPFVKRPKPIREDEKEEEELPIDPKLLEKYSRGSQVDIKKVKVSIHKRKRQKIEEKLEYSTKQAARSELLLTETNGYLEPEKDEISAQFRQSDIVNSVDTTSASKRFDLHLKDFGPYRINYTRNGRYLLLGGRRGHVAAIDWITKKLLCEINVMESTHDVCWLHQETMFAVAQKKWVHMYDNKGVELHCVKNLHSVVKMEFLPYHFLLATVSSDDCISWLDVSIGKLVTTFRTPAHGTAPTIAQHPSNALICIGQPNGTISLWSPNSKKPAVTKWCHRQPVAALAFDPYGIHLATASVDRSVKLWDGRQLSGPVQEYRLRSIPHCMSYSHKGTLAIGLGNIVEIYNDHVVEDRTEKKIYLRHKMDKTIQNMQFCPYEDVLGVGHSGGFTSLLVPGCGEANFDALEANPYQTKSQRREAEVQALLGKIPSDLITWDTKMLQTVHTPSLVEIIERKKKTLHVKPPEMEIKIRKKNKSSVHLAKAKKMLREQTKKNYFKNLSTTSNVEVTVEKNVEPVSAGVLDRFKPKIVKKKHTNV